MTTSTITNSPRIYVASLSDYNAGILHGEWIDAADHVGFIAQQIEDMLAASPTAGRDGHPAEEWAIHDHEGFCGLDVGEFMNLDDLVTIACAVAGHPEPEAIAAYLDHVGDADELDGFADAYRGCWPSVRAYAEDELEGWGILDQAEREGCELLVRYFDFDAFARDLELGGDIWTAPATRGEVYVFTSA